MENSVGVKFIETEVMVDTLLKAISVDRKVCHGPVYYEILSKENCKLTGTPNDGYTINAIDGVETYNLQKKMREVVGMVYQPPTDVTVGGVKMRRIVIRSNNSEDDFDDYFGMCSGYLQVGCEVVCYMVYYK